MSGSPSRLPDVPQGSLSMTFDGDRVRFFINIVARFTVPEGAVEGPLDMLQEGSYVIAGSDLKITLDNVEGGWGTFTGEIGGVAVNIPVPPVGDFPPVAGGPAQCDGDQFSCSTQVGCPRRSRTSNAPVNPRFTRGHLRCLRRHRSGYVWRTRDDSNIQPLDP